MSAHKDHKRGTWYFVVDVPTATGQRKQVLRRGFTTKRKALAAQAELLAQVAGGTHADPSRLTVGEFLVERWLPTLPGRVRQTTATAYLRAVNKFVPIIGHLRLQGLGAGDIQAALAHMTSGGLAAKTVRNYAGVMSKALSDAVRWGSVGRNVASGALDLPQAPPVAPRAWDAAQLARFLQATASSDLGALWRFVALTGCRRGEALGLRWSSVDLDAGTATFVSQRVVACGGGGVVEGPPKTRSGARTVRLDAETVRQLRMWRKAQLAQLVRLGVRPGHDFVFTGPDGRALWPPRVTARFQEAARSLGLPAIGVHGLRHSSATWLIGAGVSPKTVSQRLGHSTPAITLSLYAHVLPGHDQAAVDAFAAALDGPPGFRDHNVITEAD